MAADLAFSFLRPLGLPRPSTINHFLRTSRRFLSTTATPTTTPTTAEVAPTSSIRAAATTKPSILYRVTRTPSDQLPIYHLSKRGGNMKLTRIRRIDGDIMALRRELVEDLGVDEKEVVVNMLTRHVVVKGHKKLQVERFLKERGM